MCDQLVLEHVILITNEVCLVSGGLFFFFIISQNIVFLPQLVVILLGLQIFNSVILVAPLLLVLHVVEIFPPCYRPSVVSLVEYQSKVVLQSVV